MQQFTKIVFALFFCILAITAYAEENDKTPKGDEWHYKDYTFHVLPLGMDVDARNEWKLEIWKGGKKIFDDGGTVIKKDSEGDPEMGGGGAINISLPDDRHPARDITGSGHKEMVVTEDYSAGNNVNLALYLFELEPEFHLIGKFPGLTDGDYQADSALTEQHIVTKKKNSNPGMEINLLDIPCNDSTTCLPYVLKPVNGKYVLDKEKTDADAKQQKELEQQIQEMQNVQSH